MWKMFVSVKFIGSSGSFGQSQTVLPLSRVRKWDVNSGKPCDEMWLPNPFDISAGLIFVTFDEACGRWLLFNILEYSSDSPLGFQHIPCGLEFCGIDGHQIINGTELRMPLVDRPQSVGDFLRLRNCWREESAGVLSLVYSAVTDVRPDGSCFYRSFAVCLLRHLSMSRIGVARFIQRMEEAVQFFERQGSCSFTLRRVLEKGIVNMFVIKYLSQKF